MLNCLKTQLVYTTGAVTQYCPFKAILAKLPNRRDTASRAFPKVSNLFNNVLVLIMIYARKSLIVTIHTLLPILCPP